MHAQGWVVNGFLATHSHEMKKGKGGPSFHFMEKNVYTVGHGSVMVPTSLCTSRSHNKISSCSLSRSLMAWGGLPNCQRSERNSCIVRSSKQLQRICEAVWHLGQCMQLCAVFIVLPLAGSNVMTSLPPPLSLKQHLRHAHT